MDVPAACARHSSSVAPPSLALKAPHHAYSHLATVFLLNLYMLIELRDAGMSPCEVSLKAGVLAQVCSGVE